MSKLMIGSPLTSSLTKPKKKIAKLMVQIRMKSPIECSGESSGWKEINYSGTSTIISSTMNNLQSFSADKIVRLEGDASKEFPSEPLLDAAK